MANEQVNFSTELESQRKLVDLYKRYFEEATEKLEEQDTQSKATRDAHLAMVSQLNAKFKAQQEHFEGVIAKMKQESTVAIAELEQKLKAQEESSRKEVFAQEESGNAAELLGLSVTEMYDKVVEAQRELNNERGRRREAELYLNRIFKDIESKTPAIISQRREFNRLIEAHTSLTQQLDDAVAELSKVKASLISLTSKNETLERDLRQSNQQNADLSAQVQHLLRRMMEQYPSESKVALIGYEDESSAVDVVSQRLVTFDDIAELQTRNMQLLQVVRNLSEEHERSTEDNDLQASLQAAVQELQDMRESRQRTEEIVASLVQQRDMYRTIAETYESNKGPSIVELEKDVSTGKMKELENKLFRLEEETKRYTERIARLEQSEKASSEALEKARSEALSLRLDAAKAESEASFQRERSEKLEDAMKGLRQDLESASARRSELQSLLISFQQDSKRKDDELRQRLEELRTSEERCRHLEIEAEVLRKSEDRLTLQLNEVRDDLKKQAALGDSIRRIEQGLVGQKEEELATAVREKESLIKSMEALRKEYSDQSLLSEQRVAALESELRILRQRLDEKTHDYSVVKEELIKEQASLVSVRERCTLLERQLARAHEQLSNVQGGRILDAISSSQLSDSEVALERAEAECEALKAQLRTAEDHMAQYKKMSSVNEGLLNEVRQKFQSSKSAFEEEISKLKGELEAAGKEASDRRADALSALKDVEFIRNELHEVRKTYAEELRIQRETLIVTEGKVDTLSRQLEEAKADVDRFKLDAREANENYHREVTMHSKASEEVLNLQRQIDAIKNESASTSTKVSELTTGILRAEARLDEERKVHSAAISEKNAAIADLKTANDLLHNQIQSLSVQIMRFQESRNLLSQSEGVEESEELSSLRSSNAELREVVRFMKREQDVVEAKLSLSESESARLKASLASVHRALDEAKAEIRREIDRRLSARDEEEIVRLKKEVEQINLIRESNVHLRGENEEMKTKLASCQNELEILKTNEAPLRDQLRVMSAKMNAFEKERESLVADVAYWKDRLHQLVSRYNEVDPEEHRLLQSKFDEISAKLVAFEASVADQSKELKDLRHRESEMAMELVSFYSTIAFFKGIRNLLAVYWQTSNSRQRNFETPCGLVTRSSRT